MLLILCCLVLVGVRFLFRFVVLLLFLFGCDFIVVLVFWVLLCVVAFGVLLILMLFVGCVDVFVGGLRVWFLVLL